MTRDRIACAGALAFAFLAWALLVIQSSRLADLQLRIDRLRDLVVERCAVEA